MQVDMIFGFAALIGVATCSPGPNVLAVISSTLRFGARGAALAIMGNLLALLLVAGAAAFGVGGLIRIFPDTFVALKLAGATYLIWIGMMAIRSSFEALATTAPDEQREIRNISIALKTLLISLSNPKSVLFLSAVFPTFLDHSVPIFPQFAIMFLIIICVVGTVHICYALLALKMRAKLISESGKRWTARIAGLSFLGFGAGLLTEAARLK